MCGICGKLHFDPARPADARLIERMAAVLAHRGPDDRGVRCAGPIGLGNLRLAVIDLSPAGHQPMCNEDGAVWIVYNGEVYNFPALRADLEARGHRFTSHTDTETVVHLYEEYGRDCVKHLRGMFAFAIWDDRARRLLLARDRFGKKPLVYALLPDALVFGSELKAILQDPAVPRAVDRTAIHHYLTYGYVPGPWTAFQAIRKLPPASTLVWEEGRVSIERYWTLAYTPKQTIPFPEAVERTRELLREAVRLRLISDVPLGAFLSGGIDSSAMVALMAEMSAEPVKTFTIGFDDQTFTETRYARLIADRYATDHHEFTVRPDAAAVLPHLVWAYGDPFADSSALPTYYVAKLTRQHVTVALNGDGGDEAFAGYDRYLAGRLATRYERAPRWLREGLVRPLVDRLPESTDRKDLIRRIKRFTAAVHESPERRYARWIILLDNATKEQLYSPAFRAEMAGVDSVSLLEDAFARADSADLLDRTQFADVQTYLPDDLLVKADIAASMVSLEGRSPLLDHVLAEFAATLPTAYKLRGRRAKRVLKEAMRDDLPPAILNRDKQGFGMPVGAWFRGALRDTAYRVLLDPVTLNRGLLNGEAVRALLDEHTAGRINHGYRIWQLLCLELWYRTYVDRAALDGPAGGIL